MKYMHISFFLFIKGYLQSLKLCPSNLYCCLDSVFHPGLCESMCRAETWEVALCMGHAPDIGFTLP